MKSQGKNSILLTVQRSRLRVDVFEHHHEILVTQTQYRWAIKHKFVDIYLGIFVFEEIDCVED